MIIEIDGDESAADLADLFLIDGNNIAYKAFYAVPDTLTRADGFPTNALYGFTVMLDKIVRAYHPSGLAVCWDMKPTHRLELLESYKSHRKEMPDALKQQFPHFDEIVSAFGYRNVRLEGREADDVLATLACRASSAGINVCLVTNDRDSFQLCNERVSVMTTPRGLNDPVIYTPAKVEERYGIPPKLVPDYLGLKGDAGDGIPGVPGIGEKTAAQLLQEHVTLEDVLAAAAEGKIKGKKGDNLVEFADQARTSKVLATVICDLTLDCEPQDLIGIADRSQLKATMERWEFHSLARGYV